MSVSQRARNLAPSATLAIAATARRLRAQGLDVISFSQGEPDFDTPDHIKEAAIQAIREGFTKYTATGGIDELKDAVATKLKRDTGLVYARDQVMTSCGGKHSLFNVFQALLEPGDEVIIPAPYWVSFPEQVKLCGGKPVFVHTHEHESFRLHRALVEPHVTPRTRILILNSPCNPTGAVLTPKELQGLADLAADAGFWVVSDETYEALVYDGHQHVSIASFNDRVYAQTILVSSLSKAYAMPGWRIGYTAAAKEVIRAMDGLQSQETSNPTSIAQRAAVAALTGPQESVRRMREEFDRRRVYILDRLSDMPGIRCLKPQGAFYVFPNVSGTYGKHYAGTIIRNSSDFSAYLLEQARIAVVPGVEFGSDDHIRISYATSLENIQKGMDRMAEAVKHLGEAAQGWSVSA
ncbi:MAG TPA: pyridoxal phosphate-dependent aminotransferase [Candidatus Methylomirabilis sp.]|nr:pyridoxal phosphate-dependent aminotransferase [Candidatus Methylomirabilis sp.]